MPKKQCRFVCEKCGREKVETEFFKCTRHEGDYANTNGRIPICKTCLTRNINNRDPETIKPVLEMFDVPFVENEWVKKTNERFLKDPANFGPSSVFGHYLRKMNMVQWSKYHYSDTEELNKPQLSGDNKKQQKEIADHLLSTGEINQQEYENIINGRTETFVPEFDSWQEEVDQDKENKFIGDFQVINEESIAKNLTNDDIQYLALKWGTSYKPSEWVRLEDLYQHYAQEYELNVDREESVRKICKTSLKMDQALDIDDTQAYKNLSSVYDQLRKSARLTEAQNKEEQGREIDSIGQLVSLVEREGGIIPQQFDPIEYPQDKMDFIINDLQNYVSNLVRDELGLGDLIESFIEKADKQQTESVENIMQHSFNPQDGPQKLIEEEEEEEFDPAAYEQEAFKLMEVFGL